MQVSRSRKGINLRENIVTKLALRRANAQIKIEVTPVLRGSVFSPEIRAVSQAVEDVRICTNPGRIIS